MPIAQEDDPWSVRVLPRAAFGAAPTGGGGPGPEPANADAVVLHHLMGSWRGGARRRRALAPLLRWLRPLGLGLGSGADAPAPAPPAEPGHGSGGGGGGGGLGAAGNGTALELYPVSVAWEPPFSMLVDLAGAGDVQASRLAAPVGPILIAILLSYACADYSMRFCFWQQVRLEPVKSWQPPKIPWSAQRPACVCIVYPRTTHWACGQQIQNCPSTLRPVLVIRQALAGSCCRRM